MDKHDEDLPPPYTPILSTPLPHPRQSPFTAHLAAHLSSLPTLVQNAHSAHLTTQQSRDTEVLALLIPHIEALLADAAFAAANPSALAQDTLVAELTLVPAAACPRDWQWTEEDDDEGPSSARNGLLRRMVRVHPAPRKGDSKGGHSTRDAAKETAAERMAEGSRGREHEFDEWGRWGSGAGTGSSSSRDTWDSGEWWWPDEDAAFRLSRQLQPLRPALASVPDPTSPRADSKAAAPAPEPAPREKDTKEPKKSRWGFFRAVTREVVENASPVSLSSTSGPVSTPSSPIVRRNTLTDPSGADTRATMKVSPEKVTLRKENDFGIWESMSGWGIVVRLKVPGGRNR